MIFMISFILVGCNPKSSTSNNNETTTTTPIIKTTTFALSNDEEIVINITGTWNLNEHKTFLGNGTAKFLMMVWEKLIIMSVITQQNINI